MIEICENVGKSFALFAKQVFNRHFDVLKVQVRCPSARGTGKLHFSGLYAFKSWYKEKADAFSVSGFARSPNGCSKIVTPDWQKMRSAEGKHSDMQLLTCVSDPFLRAIYKVMCTIC